MSEKGRAGHRRMIGHSMASKKAAPKASVGKKAEAVSTVVSAATPAPAPPPSLPALAAKPVGGDGGAMQTRLPDFEALSLNLAKLVEEGGKALAAYLRPIEEGKVNSETADTVGDAAKTLGKIAEYWMSDPKRAMQAQSGLATNFIQLWGNTLRKLSGESEASPVAPPDPADKRFADPEWRANPIFDFLRQSYSLTTNWANQLVEHADAVDPATRERALRLGWL